MQSTEVIEVIVPEPPMGCSLALSDRGALCTVEAVQPASRAAGAGVLAGDVLLTANGQAPPIESESERALVDFFRQLRYPLRLAFARRAKDARFGDAARRAGAAAAEAFLADAAAAAPPPPRLPTDNTEVAPPPEPETTKQFTPFALAFEESGAAARRALELATPRRPSVPIPILDEEAQLDDPILAMTRESLYADSPDFKRERRKRAEEKIDPLPVELPSRCERLRPLWKHRNYMLTAFVGFSLGYAYVHLRFVEDFQRGF